MATPTPKFSREIRFRWYHLVERQGLTVAAVCRLYGMARKTYYRWYAPDHGRRSPRYHSPQPHPALKLTANVRQLIEREKLRTNYGPLKMKLLLQRRLHLTVSTTVLYRYYQRKGLVRRPQKRLPWYQPLREAIMPRHPGEVVQVDTKYVWSNGQRQYQRTFVDVYTGFHHAVVVPTIDAQATVTAFGAAEQMFPFPILGMQSDNGSENRGVFHQYLGQRGIAHYFIPKSSPNWDGAVERAHGVIDAEFYLNPRRPWKTLAAYLRWYNYERIHLGKYLNGLIPIEKFQQYQSQHPKSVTLEC